MFRNTRVLGALGGTAFTTSWWLHTADQPAFALETTTKPAVSPSSPAEGDKLKLVQVVFRHGARSPLGRSFWPELVDAWDVCGTIEELKKPVALHITTVDGQPRPVNSHDHEQVNTILKGGCRKGELTKIGQKQAVNFGSWMRHRYVEQLKYLDHNYTPGTLLSRSTNYSRTIATLQGVLTGLYPDAKTPIPVHTTEELDEVLYGNVKSCKRLGEVIKELTAKRNTTKSPHAEWLSRQVVQVLEIPEATKTVNMVELHDAMTSMITHGKKVPEGMIPLLKDIEIQATKRFLNILAPDAETGKREEVLRLGMGRLMELLIRRMQEASSSVGDKAATMPKMYAYSGHDSTILPLLVAINGHVDHWPEYMSNLIFELWETPETGKHYVRVLYNKEELPLFCRFCGGSQENVGLEQFSQYILGPYLLTKDAQEDECAVLHFSHSDPAGENVRGEVKVGSSLEETDEDSPNP